MVWLLQSRLFILDMLFRSRWWQSSERICLQVCYDVTSHSSEAANFSSSRIWRVTRRRRRKKIFLAQLVSLVRHRRRHKSSFHSINLKLKNMIKNIIKILAILMVGCVFCCGQHLLVWSTQKDISVTTLTSM